MLKKENTILVRKPNFVTYTSNNEVIVTTPEKEEEAIAAYFSIPEDRDITEYDRTQHFDEAVTIVPEIKIQWG